MLATPPGYRPEHFEAAVERQETRLLREAVRHRSGGRAPLHGRRQEIRRAEAHRDVRRAAPFATDYHGDRQARLRTARSATSPPLTPTGSAAPVIQQKARDPKWGDMSWQHRAWYSFVWICGDQIVEQHLHNIDVCNWVMGTHPVKVRGLGRRHLASHGRDLRQHLRPHHRRFRLRQRRRTCRATAASTRAAASPERQRAGGGHQGPQQRHDMGSGTKQDVRKRFRNRWKIPTCASTSPCSPPFAATVRTSTMPWRSPKAR